MLAIRETGQRGGKHRKIRTSTRSKRGGRGERALRKKEEIEVEKKEKINS